MMMGNKLQSKVIAPPGRDATRRPVQKPPRHGLASAPPLLIEVLRAQRVDARRHRAATLLRLLRPNTYDYCNTKYAEKAPQNKGGQTMKRTVETGGMQHHLPAAEER